MNKSLDNDHCSPARADQARNEAEPDHLAELEARLVQGLQRALADGRLDLATIGSIDLEELARRLASRSGVMDRRHARVVAWMKRVDRRLSRVEARVDALTNQAADQQESTRMICAILKDLDDPYGLGVSLDERLARDESERTSDEEG
jgi:hypothetical protein